MTHKTHLSKWLEASGLSRAAFAQSIGSDKSNVTRWCNGSRVPTLVTARKIEEVTKGAVTVEDWGYRYPADAAKRGVDHLWIYVWEEGISVSELARRIPASPMSVRHWMAGKFRPQPEFIERINKLLDADFTADDFGA